MSWIQLYDQDGKEINLNAIGLIGLKLNIPSPSYSRETEVLEGVPGERVIEKRLNSKTLTAEFWSKSKNYRDSLRARDSLYALIGNGETFYVSESNQPGKRFKVHVDDWEPARINSRITSFEIPLFVETGTAETMNITPRKYNVPTFQFKNEGSSSINMLHQNETEIEFRGASTNLKIRNKTTGELWTYTGGTDLDDVILLKGVRSTKNGQSIFGNTNKKMISFAVGWNDFEIEGVTGDFEIIIRTRFYFL